MAETPVLRQIETLHPATLTVLLLTCVVSRHMMRSTKLPLAFFSLWCYHARVRVHGCVLRQAHMGPRRAVSHAGGLTHPGRCNCLGVGVWAVLGPVQRRFGFESFQPSVKG